ncbi:transcriptional repressor [Solirubrobacter phytolaccae]|uniref:Transcriptional repressor n=1 Tax=Solirubrobacter phytolaccae TaxID=1404360 RepID=A0A9X3N9C5_9ACTN|nr:transcriptional repressor [Solirubrobacter phytolaccae]MDA0181859.1 transcriptional repressor [Solirubrobacter phytolaccae]
MTEAALLTTVRAHGLRVSAARRHVLGRLLAAEQPLTAEELAGGGDVASVYRNLHALETIGVVRHVHLGHGPGRYALSTRAAGWVTCELCGRSTPLSADALSRIRAAVFDVAGVDARFDHFPIVGRCAKCI